MTSHSPLEQEKLSRALTNAAHAVQPNAELDPNQTDRETNQSVSF